MQKGFTGIWQKLKCIYKDNLFKIEQDKFNMDTSHSFSLPKDYSLELSSHYQSATLFLTFAIEDVSSRSNSINAYK